MCPFATVIVAKSSMKRWLNLTDFQRRLKLEGFGLLGSEMYVKIFLQSLEHEFAACIFKGEEGPKPWCQFPSLFPSKPVQESFLQRNRPLPNRSRGSTTSSKVQTCQELAEYSSSTKQAVCNGNNSHHCFHDYISTTSCNFDSGVISKEGPRDKDIQFYSNSTNSGVQATVEMMDFGV